MTWHPFEGAWGSLWVKTNSVKHYFTRNTPVLYMLPYVHVVNKKRATSYYILVKARLHRRLLSQQLDAVFVALKLQLQNRRCKPGAIFSAICRRDIAGVLNMFETWCNLSATKIASSCRDKNHLCKRAFTFWNSEILERISLRLYDREACQERKCRLISEDEIKSSFSVLLETCFLRRVSTVCRWRGVAGLKLKQAYSLKGVSSL